MFETHWRSQKVSLGEEGGGGIPKWKFLVMLFWWVFLMKSLKWRN